MANDVMAELGGMIPDISGSQVANFFGIFIGIILLGIFLTILVIWLINFLKFNKKVVLFKRIGNQIVPVLFDRGQFARVGTAGDQWCILKKYKKTIPKPRIQMRKNEYWYYEREDGEWINFSLGDFDQQMKKANAYYVDEDMRLQRLGIQKNLQERFNKVTFWQKYGGMIISIVYILVVTICFVVLFKQMDGAWDKAGSMASAVRDMALEVRNLRQASGSGAVPVGGFVISTGSWFGQRLLRKKKYAIN